MPRGLKDAPVAQVPRCTGIDTGIQSGLHGSEVAITGEVLMGLLILNVPPKVDAWLDDEARRSAIQKNDLALKLLEEAAAGQTDVPVSRAETQKLLRDFEQWCNTRPIRTGHPVDDSRESIYG